MLAQMAEVSLVFDASADVAVREFAGGDVGKLLAHGDGAGEFDRGVAAGGAEHSAGLVRQRRFNKDAEMHVAERFEVAILQFGFERGQLFEAGGLYG